VKKQYKGTPLFYWLLGNFKKIMSDAGSKSNKNVDINFNPVFNEQTNVNT
jgi:hypothetical protein